MSSIYLQTDTVSSNGWTGSLDEIWTYTSSDQPTFVVSVTGDVTLKYAVGMKLKYTQSATTKYCIVTAVGSYSSGKTAITVYGGGGDGSTFVNSTAYTMTSATISNVYYSTSKSPSGFPLTVDTWSYILSNTNNYTSSSGTFVEISSSLRSSLPIGVWRAEFSVAMQQTHASVVDCWAEIALSSSSNSVSHQELKVSTQGVRNNSLPFDFRDQSFVSANLSVTTKTSMYVVIRTYSGRTGNLAGANRTTIIKYVCNYV